MFKPVAMKKVRLGVLDHYVENVIRELSKLGVVHIVDIKERVGASIELDTEIENRNSEQCADYLRRINNVIDLLDVVEEYNVFGELKTLKEKIVVKEKSFNEQLNDVKNRFESIEKKILPIHERLAELKEREEKLLNDRRELRIMKLLEIDLDWIKESSFTHTAAGLITPEELDSLIEELDSALGDEYIELKTEEKTADGRAPVVVSTAVGFKEKLDEVLNSIDFTPVSLTDYDGKPAEALDSVSWELEEIGGEKQRLMQQLNSYKMEHTDDLFVMREVVSIEKDIADVGELLGRTKRVYILEGWIPERSIQDMLRKIRKVTDENIFVRIEDPKEEDVVPTFLDNPGIFKPFELLTETFGSPSYKEIDPTPILAITFPLIFGLMFGDVGHGFMVSLVGITLYTLGRKAIKDLGFITLACGISAIVFGVLYNDYFGLHGYVFGLPEKPPWINPMSSPLDFLLIAIGVGVIHISVGLIVDLAKMLRKREYKHAVIGPLSKIWVYFGLIAFGYLYTSQGIAPLMIVPLAVLPLAIIGLEGIINHFPDIKPVQALGHLGEGAFEAFDTVLIFLSNTISYSRIFALVMVHGGLFTALFSVTGTFTGIHVGHGLIDVSSIMSLNGLLWFIIIFIGTVAIIALEGLIVFLHTLRLHYYEWFTKFFDADGSKYIPFNVQRTYTSTRE